jgi:hypothetical protein
MQVVQQPDGAAIHPDPSDAVMTIVIVFEAKKECGCHTRQSLFFPKHRSHVVTVAGDIVVFASDEPHGCTALEIWRPNPSCQCKPTRFTLTLFTRSHTLAQAEAMVERWAEAERLSVPVDRPCA